jgi:hypothetical protein
MPKRSPKLPPAVTEFAGALLPDARLSKRLEVMVELADRDPAASLPQMTQTEAGREAAYRFLHNERVEFDAVLQPHLDQSARRAVAAKCVLAVHDTTTFKLDGSRGNDSGYINTGARGFYLHATIAVENTEERACLGLLKATTLFRESPRKTKKKALSGAECAALEDRESSRWWEHVDAVQTTLGRRCEVIHVADSEADQYPLLANMKRTGCRFVTRLARDRRARSSQDEPWALLSEVAGTAEQVAKREVALSARGDQRPPRTLKKFPPRDARLAQLRFAAMSVELKRPSYLGKDYPAALEVNAVRVYEVDAPDDTEPVEWFLLTSEPIATQDDVLAVVDIYRRRWVIEEYFRAVKTGCAYEERQLEGRHAWLIALSITLPLAWRLLQLRAVARQAPDRPASSVLTKTEIAVLHHLRPNRVSARPTIREAMLGIAEMGGHIKNNGEPGWLVLHRGLSKLQGLAEGVDLAHEMNSGRRPSPREM